MADPAVALVALEPSLDEVEPLAAALAAAYNDPPNAPLPAARAAGCQDGGCQDGGGDRCRARRNTEHGHEAA